MKYFAKLKALAKRKKQCRGNIRDFSLAFIADAKFASQKANYFLPNSDFRSILQNTLYPFADADKTI